jgi:predicted amidophosphoribosyltransferase
MEQPQTARGHCSTCGAPYPEGAALCTSCGAPVASAVLDSSQSPGFRDIESEGLALTSQPASTSASAEVDDGTAIAGEGSTSGRVPATDSSDMQRCAWCGALSAASEQACEHCGAAFPKPEADDAFLRASQERIRLANDSIAMLRKERERKGIGRLFGR